MAIFRCKMCGGDLEIVEGQSVCTCEFCGTEQTVSLIENDKIIKLYDRANRLRLASEFDKAESVYESIIEELDTEAEAYWGMLLCKYGIEYVDDPTTGNKIPTCHRSSFTCFLDEEDFEHVMENADVVARNLYREQAKQIEEIRKGIIEVSGREQPYDIFICYKETDENGERTIDSVLAQDVYDALTSKGYRVFFSRISLEDKLGTEYEPYIFAALNSAKVMLAFGTSYDYYNAVWVKNEWSRYLKLMATDKSRHLIPCYKDIDAYDIPKEFRPLQAQDMGKVGAIQDLIRGVDKLVGRISATPEMKQQILANVANVDALLKRGYDSLEDGAFEEAKNFFDDALNSDAQSAEAYLGLFMTDLKAKNRSVAQSRFVSEDYTQNRYWKRAKQYASETLAETLNNWDYLREEHLQKEADEAEQKAREAEREKKKILETIKQLQEQIRTENYGLTEEEIKEQERLNAEAQSTIETYRIEEKALEQSSEMQEVITLRSIISQKKAQLSSLGFFKSKEKLELQAQIDAIGISLEENEKKISDKKYEIILLKKQAENANKRAENYNMPFRKKKIDLLQNEINKMMSLDGGISFGNYYGVIKWIILEMYADKALIISKYALEMRKYNTLNEKVTWENCSLRGWLNSVFLSSAFSSDEKQVIVPTCLTNADNPKHRTDGGNDTTDHAFLLSIAEVEKYLSSDHRRKATLSNGKATCWWLRTPGINSSSATDVDNDGTISVSGKDVFCDDCSVRPALWIDIVNFEFSNL